MQYRLLETKYEDKQSKIELIEQEMENPKMVNNRLEIVKNFVDQKGQQQLDIKNEKQIGFFVTKKQEKEKEFFKKQLNSDKENNQLDLEKEVTDHFVGRKKRFQSVFDKMIKGQRDVDRLVAATTQLEKDTDMMLNEAIAYANELYV